MTIAGEGFQFDYTVNTLVMRAIANGNIVSAPDSQNVALLKSTENDCPN